MSRPRNVRGEGGRLREEILDAAVALVDEAGDARVLTLRGIARRARISAPSIYAHFDDLPTLVDAVIALSFEHLRRRISAAVERSEGEDPVAALVAAAKAYVEFGWDHRARYQLMFAAEGYAPNAIETYATVQALISTCVEKGMSASTDPRLDTWMLWASLHGVATLEKPGRPDRRRLGTLDRLSMLETIVHRVAQVTTLPPTTSAR